VKRWSWHRLGSNKRAWRRAARTLDSRLENAYQSPGHGNYVDPTDELFYILLSKKTPPDRYRSIYKEMRRLYSPWDRLLIANRLEVENLLKPLGFAKVRTKQILEIAKRLHRDFCRVSLDLLCGKEGKNVKDYLITLPGVGEKSARCIMMYSMEFDISPMDTHAIRILMRLGLLPHECTPARAHRLIDERVAKGMSRRLHKNIVAFGRAVCRALRPRCEECFISGNCDSWSSLKQAIQAMNVTKKAQSHGT
jgi:endonuclease III